MRAARRRAVPGLVVLLLLGCKASPREVVVYTSVDQVFSEPLFQAFERASGLQVKAVFDTEETKSTGVLNRLLAEAPSPRADVFWCNDPARPFLLARRGLLAAYRSPAAADLPPAHRAADGTWTQVAARVRVLLVNTALVPPAERPRSIRDLAEPRWRGRAAIANPLYGTTTMHVAALAAAWGEGPLKDFLDALKANQVRVAASNGEVKRLVAAGEVAIGLADSDDGEEAVREGSPVAVVVPDQDGPGALVMPTTVVLLAGAPHLAAGQRLVDWLVSAEAERRLGEGGAHLALRPGAPGPTGGPRVAELKAMEVDFAAVAEELERLQPWLRRWTGL